MNQQKCITIITSNVNGKRGIEYLRQISKEVEFPDSDLNDNIETLRDYFNTDENVLALAAIQLGIPKRIIYVKISDLDIAKERNTPGGKEATKSYNENTDLINPIIVRKSGLTTFWESCASCEYINETGETILINGEVKRPYKITVEFMNEEGEKCRRDFEGFAATVICHEIDHLDGILHYDIAEKIKLTDWPGRRKLIKDKGYTVIEYFGDYEQLKGQQIGDDERE